MGHLPMVVTVTTLLLLSSVSSFSLTTTDPTAITPRRRRRVLSSSSSPPNNNHQDSIHRKRPQQRHFLTSSSSLHAALRNPFEPPPADDKTDSAAAASFTPVSKENEKVIIDPKTGLYRPMKARKTSDKPSAQDSWDGFKTVVYNGVDLLTRLNQERQQQERDDDNTNNPPAAQSFRTMTPGRQTLSELSNNNNNNNNPQSSTLVGGYQEREAEFLSSLAKASPAQRLLAEFQQKEAEDVLAPPSAFDSFKTAVYKGMDQVEDQVNNNKKSASAASSPRARLQAANNNSLQSKQTQARLLAWDEEFLQAMQDTQSDNPVTRLAAGYKVKRMIEKDDTLQRKRALAAQREAQIKAFKNGVYQVGDALVQGTQALVALPEQVANTYQTTVRTTQSTIQAAQALPEKLGSQVEAVQQSVQGGVQTGQQIVEQTKNIPNRVREQMEETSESVQRKKQQTQKLIDGTKQTMNNLQSTAQEITTSSKVMLGMEKPQPRPPRSDPPREKVEEFSAANLGWKALRVTGSLAGKATWIVGKETAKLAWKGAGYAVSKSAEALEERAAEQEKRKALAAEAFGAKQKQKEEEQEPEPSSLSKDTEPEPAATVAPPTAAELIKRQEEMEAELVDLEQEIEEALRLAEDAISSAKAELGDRKRTDDDKATNDKD